MRRSLLLCCGIWLVAGCRDAQAPAGDPAAGPAGADAPYRGEVADICFAEERSGALEQPGEQRMIIVAQWLGTRIHTQQGRDLLAAVARASPAEKVTLLQAEAARLDLASCPLAQSWGGGAPGTPAPATPAP
jgi:hypothetical protein